MLLQNQNKKIIFKNNSLNTPKKQVFIFLFNLKTSLRQHGQMYRKSPKMLSFNRSRRNHRTEN